ncbi:hypothetical protein [Xanthomonas campestris]|uniref:Uncharacterized protein n=1 Tax=Xanthomonas campestris pv. papavericola TaxID=487881 RepID=A0AAJ2X1G1_XANCA|nr:hypothetical protein [Xanthomonas campestris]MEC3887456.1 hypothetical protein [Xanthomonas campestris pv. papavericola]
MRHPFAPWIEIRLVKRVPRDEHGGSLRRAKIPFSAAYLALVVRRKQRQNKTL